MIHLVKKYTLHRSALGFHLHDKLEAITFIQLHSPSGSKNKFMFILVETFFHISEMIYGVISFLRIPLWISLLLPTDRL